MASIYALAECGSCLVQPRNDGGYERLMKEVVARGPKIVYEAYNNRVQEEVKSSSCLTSSGGVLKVSVRSIQNSSYGRSKMLGPVFVRVLESAL